MIIRLPVSGLAVQIRPMTGTEELRLLEAQETVPAALTLLLLEHLATVPGGEPHDWQTLPAPDADALLLYLRQAVFGDAIAAVSNCPQADCGAKIDVSLSIAEYLNHHWPDDSPDVDPESGAEWFRLRNADMAFRIPSLGDQIGVRHEADPASALKRLCIRPFPLAAADEERIEDALDLLAPSGWRFAVDLPAVRHRIAAAVCPRAFVLREFQEQAAFVYGDVHTLAGAYCWTEAAILALPRRRRLSYVELI